MYGGFSCEADNINYAMQNLLFFVFLDHWSVLYLLELGLAILISKTSPENGRYELHWLCAPAFTGDELLCSLGSTCMHARWPHWPRQIDQFSFLNISHAHGRQEVSTADCSPPLALPVHMYKYKPAL